jgi:hypothetical protein
MKQWKQLAKIVLMSVMALTLVAGYGVSVSATGLQTGGAGNTPLLPANAVMKKKLEVPPGLPVPAVEFTYDFVFDNFNGDTTLTGLDITSVTATFAPSNTVDTSLATLTAHDGHGVVTQNTTSILAGIPSYASAGAYVYTVTENGTTNPATLTNGQISVMSQAEYRMTVFVENETDGAGKITGGVYVKAIGYESIKNDAGNIVPAEPKTDPIFINRYEATTDLEISKTVIGVSADVEQEFTYDLVLTKINDIAIVDNYGATLNGTPQVNFISFPADTNTVTKTFTLKHDDKLVIENLPAGTTYTITERATPAYLPNVNVTINGGTSVGSASPLAPNATMTVGTGGNTGVAVLDTGAIILGINSNEINWLNTRTDISPTGILINNLPYILLIVVAIGGFAGYIVSKRRKATR